MKNKKIVLAVSILFLSALCISNVPAMSTNDASNENLKSQNFATADAPKREVISYVDVLRTYYNLATENVENPSVDFNAFYDDYYAPGSNRDLYTFTLKLAADNGNFESVCKELNISDYESFSPFTSSSKDEYYILKSLTDFKTTPKDAFTRRPDMFVYDYSSLLDGDIVYETKTILNIGHNAIIRNTQHDSDYGNYIQTIEAVAGGVQFGFLDDRRITGFKCEILRAVNVTGAQVERAIYFAREQIGKPYGINPWYLSTDINTPKWYCSQLVYACYRYVGIDIGVRKDKDGHNVYVGNVCWPSDLDKSYNTEYVSVRRIDYGFLKLEIVKKKGKVWTIRIHNKSSIELRVAYNAKMCFKDDAQYWRDVLNDINQVIINKYSSATVDITENWFATSIVASYIKGPYRVITYADRLNPKSLSLDEHTNVIKM